MADIGMSPRLGDSPPKSSFSIIATLLPSAADIVAAAEPPAPEPITIKSKSNFCLAILLLK